jgi:hypothetical protein
VRFCLWFLGLPLMAGPVAAAHVDAYAVGDIADCTTVSAAESRAAATSRLVPEGALVLVPGDAVYGRPTLDNYRACYQPSWGRHLAHTLAVPGNHDYLGDQPEGFLAYFAAGASREGHFARRVGQWLIIGLDSELLADSQQRQLQWLRATLEANRDARCTLAMWHRPLFSSGLHHGSGERMRPFWALLEEFGADLVVNGHEHFYEAFEPVDAAGNPVAAGLREFVVGTGGAPLRGFWGRPYASRARLEQHGVLHLVLRARSYEWEFIGVDGKVFDPGRAACRRAAGSAGPD